MRRFFPSEGLGPAYSAVSCAGCHEKPVVGGGASRYRGVFVAATQPSAFLVSFEQHFTVDSIARFAPEHEVATHVPPPFFGVGLLAEIPTEEIIARADPNDRDGDGVSGKVNFERGFVGRFGRKAQMASIQGFVRLALRDHMGITTSPVKTPYIAQGAVPQDLPTVDADGVADPELSPGDLGDLLAFVGLLAPPAPDALTPTTRAGERLFEACGCATCHVPSLNGPRGPVAAYTDLLLHDMGVELADGVSVGEAGESEFRTQPLWGLAAAGPLMHDGRADTVDEAIRAHGGEASRARLRYEALTPADGRTLLAFLESLGGRDVRADGLLPRDAPLVEPGHLGGPVEPLSAADATRFARGRDLFDHDFSRSEGLGPRFNGDACRSCHFLPVLGGAGPSDVDVIRHGTVRDDGTFIASKAGDTMAHRFDVTGARPPLDPDANLFERRQTPALFGLGLVDAIADDALRPDPEDRDRDGVRGVRSVLADGRTGRFGWKAQFATLADFVADAFTNELGVIPPAIDDVVFFVARLAPPRRHPGATGEDARGSALFSRWGCGACHTPALPTRDGRLAPLFSDLLLHDVAPKDQRFVGSRGFRTPPLWGVDATAPYFHDGQAETLDAAVRHHDGEAVRSRQRYVDGSDGDRVALIAFLRSL